MYAVYAREETPPEGSERIEWMLLTTLEVTTDKMALKCIGCYKRRWKIEEFFRVLKSGCGVENHKLNDAKKLERIIAITMIISWRVMLLTMLGRKCPNLPANFITKISSSENIQLAGRLGHFLPSIVSNITRQEIIIVIAMILSNFLASFSL